MLAGMSTKVPCPRMRERWRNLRMRVPSRNIGAFANDVIGRCSASRLERIQRGSLQRALFLTGDPAGNTQTYPKTYAYIDNLASWLYSGVDLSWAIESYGEMGPNELAMGKAAIPIFSQHMRQGNVDTEIEEAVLWSLIKGKTFIKMNWAGGGFEPVMIQPELMGVEREDQTSLDNQEAFFQTSWYTLDAFAKLLATHNPGTRAALMRKAMQYANTVRAEDRPDKSNTLKQVVLGGLYPFQAGNQDGGPKLQGWVDWLGGPKAELSPQMMARLVQVDELWVKDDARDDYTTIMMIAGQEDGVIWGDEQHRNLFADPLDKADKSLKGKPNPENPLKGHHPYIEFSPNRLHGYFWGRSELCNVGLLQIALNRRIDGINLILRRQEQPPRMYTGTAGVTQQTQSRLSKPGGWLVEPNPNAKMQNVEPELPTGLWESLKETLQMFDDMGGMTPTISGRGESGVRAQAHAETLVRTGTPRFKDRAISVERSIEDLANLGLGMLKVHVAQDFTGWVTAADAGLEAEAAEPNNVEEPPVKGFKPIKFQLSQIPDSLRVIVDAHSASPAFVHEAEQKMEVLFKAGAISAEDLIAGLHPPREKELMASLARRQAAQAEFVAQHPEAIEKGGKKKGH